MYLSLLIGVEEHWGGEGMGMGVGRGGEGGGGGGVWICANMSMDGQV